MFLKPFAITSDGEEVKKTPSVRFHRCCCPALQRFHILDDVCLIEHYSQPLDRHRARGAGMQVLGEGCVGGDDDILLG